jgi:hypothetical protein
MDRTTFIVFWAKSMSPHFTPNNSLCRKPVDAAIKTNVRSRILKTNALISVGARTVGGLRRFALDELGRLGCGRTAHIARHG